EHNDQANAAERHPEAFIDRSDDLVNGHARHETVQHGDRQENDKGMDLQLGGEKYNQYNGYYKPDNQHGQILYLLCLVQVPVYSGAGFSYQHIHVGTFFGLLDMVEVEPHIPTRGHMVGGLPVGPAPCKFLIGNMQMQSSIFHVQFDLV